jgi:hypothetical protein
MATRSPGKSVSVSHPVEMVAIDPHELQAAQARDRNHDA